MSQDPFCVLSFQAGTDSPNHANRLESQTHFYFSDKLTLFLLFLIYLQPLITLEGSITFTFSVEGMNTITVQVSAGNTILQDTKTIAVYGEPSPLNFA